MKKRLYILIIVMGIMCTACGNSKDAAGKRNEANVVDSTGEAANTNADSTEEEADKADTAGETADNNADTIGGTAEKYADTTVETPDKNDGATEETADNKNDDAEAEYIIVENPSEDYYCIDSAVLYGNESVISLDMLTEEANDITDTEKWFADNGLENIEFCDIEDEKYRYELDGDDGYSRYILRIYDKTSGEHLKTLDFSEYRYANEYKESDYDFIEQRIWWVQSVDDILYVAIGHNTYTESAPKNGYMTAIDLKDASVIWKSAPCVTNARNFAIIDDTIVCGYGFTSEPDNLNLLNITDGELVKQIPLKTMADYIICKGDTLYVRTYNTNYIFKIGKAG
ncbi:MAG: hypothetical protein K2K46_13655 [Lachnospiraceae bacterium]|nr:hypothetical protein [Lachnospiraceae bacterium]